MDNFHLSAAAMAALVASASASFKINNWCPGPVHVRISHNGSCDKGANGQCDSAPYVINPGAIMGFDWTADGAGTSMKISKPGVNGILQFEYSVTDGIYWDLSDLDGKGPSLVGTPFRNDNVKVTPTGNGVGAGTCLNIRCRAGQICLDSYQHPDDVNTRWCPRDTGNMWLDLCQPVAGFDSKRDSQHLSRHMIRHVSI